jgi:hypothetical protein
MTFSNKKEEVFDVQLTSEGRRLLSLGRFKPKYYAFYDDDVLYDIGYADGEETQNLIQDRILDETQYPKTNARFKEAVEKGQANFKSSKQNFQNIKKDIYLNESPYLTPLGSYNSQVQQAPYFDLEILSNNINGLFTSSAQVVDNAAMTIPQLNITCSYRYFYSTSEDTVYVAEDPLFFILKEENTQFTNFTEDFEIEVYEMTGSTTSLSQPKLFILEDTSPKTPQEITERQLKVEIIREDVDNLLTENLEVFLDQSAESLFSAELLTTRAPNAKSKVVCEDK